ncbi:MAG: hypothetical protein HOD72_00610 [Opitutae bacterium]|nr:hypothetical protein [Opitutae bacterium]
MKPTLDSIHGQPSYSIRSDKIEAHVTKLAGMLGPVAFDLGKKKVSPFSVAPWSLNEEVIDVNLPPLLHSLRGDFFCLPFGGNESSFRGETHPPHGETANLIWTPKKHTYIEGQHELHLQLKTKVRSGLVDKYIHLRDGHDAIYQRHVISGMNGPMPLGHHAMLKFPDSPGSGQISTSGFIHGQVLPFPFENPESGGYHALKPDSKFRSLKKVSLNSGGHTDLSSYPARKGFDDLALLVNKPGNFAWTAVTFQKERYVYFALKDPRVLASTVLWMSNAGRHYHPWNGRHESVLGIEDVTAYYHVGIAESVKKNALRDKGFITHIQLRDRNPFTVNHILGMANIPPGFDIVKKLKPINNSSIQITSQSGKQAIAKVDSRFLYETVT